MQNFWGVCVTSSKLFPYLFLYFWVVVKNVLVMSEQLLMGWKVGSVFAMTGCTCNERLSISLIWEVFVFVCFLSFAL